MKIVRKFQTKIVEIPRIFKAGFSVWLLEKISTTTSASSVRADYIICNVFYDTCVPKATKESDYVTLHAS